VEDRQLPARQRLDAKLIFPRPTCFCVFVPPGAVAHALCSHQRVTNAPPSHHVGNPEVPGDGRDVRAPLFDANGTRTNPSSSSSSSSIVRRVSPPSSCSEGRLRCGSSFVDSVAIVLCWRLTDLIRTLEPALHWTASTSPHHRPTDPPTERGVVHLLIVFAI
jgi:hypothetical protein